MKQIIQRIFSALFFLIFGFSILAVALGVYNGTSKNMTLFLKMLMAPTAMIDNPSGAMYISAVAFIQIFIIWGFYYCGRKLWVISLPVSIDKEITEST